MLLSGMCGGGRLGQLHLSTLKPQGFSKFFLKIGQDLTLLGLNVWGVVKWFDNCPGKEYPLHGTLLFLTQEWVKYSYQLSLSHGY